MSRALRIARALALPLLALAGFALLAWGVAGWWLFHRELFVEEIAAIEALAGKDGVVEYRRQGETMSRVYDGTKPKREAILWAVPFVPRVEGVYLIRRGDPVDYPPTEERDRILRLPGLKAYEGPDYGIHPHSTYPWHDADDAPLGRRLPLLPKATLDPRALTESMPDGEWVDESELGALARQIEAAWRADEPVDSRLLYSMNALTAPSYPGGHVAWGLTLRDGERRFEASCGGEQGAYATGPTEVRFDDGETIFDLADRDRGWTLDAFRPRDATSLAAWERPWSDDEADVHAIETMYAEDRAWELLGPQGENVACAFRIDDSRYCIETGPWKDPDVADRTMKLTAVVNRDFDWGIERYLVEDVRDDSDVMLFAGVAELAKVGGRSVVVESLAANDAFDFRDGNKVAFRYATSPPKFDRKLYATEFDPDYSETLFDARSYEPTLPLPQRLPAWRTYYAPLIVGGACLLIAIAGFGGWAALRLSLRTQAGSDSDRRFSLRFGLATLLVVALLVISLAGWIKEKLDDARDETALLAGLSRARHGFRVERRPAGFPWMFFSTDSLPLDAPLARIEFDHAPPPETLEQLLRHSPVVELVAGNPLPTPVRPGEPRKIDRASAFGTLGELVPEFEAFDPESNMFDPLPTGKPYEGESRKNIIDMALEAWAKSAATPPPRRYVVRESGIESERLTVRDGERYRIVEPTVFVEPIEFIECRDGSFRRRFAPADDGWRLALRQSLTPEGEEVQAPRVARKYRSFAIERAESGRVRDMALNVVAEMPVTEVRPPRLPFCVPPCLDGLVPDLDEALRCVTTDDVVSAQPIDLNRVRFDLRFPYAAYPDAPADPRAGATAERPWVTEWSIVVRSDLEWAVERCVYADEYGVPADRMTPDLGLPFEELVARTEVAVRGSEIRTTRKILLRNDLDWGDDGPRFDGSSFRVDEHVNGYEGNQLAGTATYAVAFPDSLPDALFDRATLDDPAPPLPEERSTFRWYAVTAALSGLALVVLGARRTLARLRTPRGETA